MNKKIKRKIALFASFAIASQLLAAPFATAHEVGESLYLATDKAAVAETQKLIDAQASTPRQMEKLNRGLIAFKSGKEVMLTWRWLGTESAATTYNIYRNGTKLIETSVDATSFYDVAPIPDGKYQIAPVVDGVEGEKSKSVTVWDSASLKIPLQKPDKASVNAEEYTYFPGDASVGDLDGDGEYEIILKWDPSNAKDAASTGYTGNCLIDAYKLDGTRLWRIDLGKNIRSGAHDTQFIVMDFDGDGKAEVAMRTADGTVAGNGAIVGKEKASWALMGGGKNLGGPLYLTVFKGTDGSIIDTTDYDPQTGDVSVWGDGYGNRSERYLATTAYLNGKNPSMVFARGYYGGQSGSGVGRTVIAAFDLVGGKIQKKWTFDSLNEGKEYIGQGNHSMAVADVDFDGFDEIIYGAMNVDHDGKPMYTTGQGHGDAQHTGDLIPDRAGYETWSVHEGSSAPNGAEMRDARTGEIIFGTDGDHGDVARGVSDDIDPNHYGAESWGDGVMVASDGKVIATTFSVASNFLAYWDGDLGREVQDNIYISKWNPVKAKTETIFKADGCISINGTKSNPCLTADIFGDWREEIIYPTQDGNSLVIFTTDVPTGYKIPTLMHDSMYRTYIATQNVCYNQPSHTGYYLGYDTVKVPVPQIFVKDGDKQVTNPDLAKKTWNVKDLARNRGVVLALDKPKASIDGKIVRIDNENDTAAPFLAEGGRTLVPLRFVSESFGANVEWDDATRGITITLGNIVIKMSADSKEYTVNGEQKTLDVGAANKDGRLYLPLRAIGEALGKTVAWNPMGLIHISDIDTVGKIVSENNDFAKMLYDNIDKAQLPETVKPVAIVPTKKLYENQVPVFAVSASSNDGNAEAGAVDGNMETRWSASGPNWIELDLGSEVSIGGVAIAMWKGDERIYPFSIEVSVDGDTWTNALPKTKNSGLTFEAEPYMFPAPVTARYVRYVGDGDLTPGKNYCHISEIVVMKAE